MPAYASKGPSRGNENVSAEHLTIPRIKLLQKMSDEVDRHHANFIEGAKDGDFMNSLTREILGTELYVISITFKDEYVVWKDRKKGGGFLGSFRTEAEARTAIDAQDAPEDFATNQTHSHILVIKDVKTGGLSKPVIMDFTSSKLRVSRNWNSQINIRGGDRFASLWKLESVPVKNKKGDAFMNLEIGFVGWAQEDDYKKAETYYEQMK